MTGMVNDPSANFGTYRQLMVIVISGIFHTRVWFHLIIHVHEATSAFCKIHFYATLHIHPTPQVWLS
jgi:hypothetical protein